MTPSSLRCSSMLLSRIRLPTRHNNNHKYLLVSTNTAQTTNSKNRASTSRAMMGNTTSGVILAAIVGLSGCWVAGSSATTTTTRLEGVVGQTKSEQANNKDPPQPPHTLFVWDFDWTVVNCNSDEYIPAQFLDDATVKKGFQELYKSTGGNWHACVEGMVTRAMNAAKEKGGGVGGRGGASTLQIMNAARQMPYLTGVRQALNEIHAMPDVTAQMILSDGNTLFIGAFLEKEGMVRHFSHGVISNEGRWTKDDRLAVVHQSQQYGGHSCNRCAANLCKTQALEKTLAQHGLFHWVPQKEGGNNAETPTNKRRRPRIVYIGDGANDACPVLNVLGEGDVLLARVGCKRTIANSRKGPETDEEAKHTRDITSTNTIDEKKKGSPFGIVPALQRAKEGGAVSKCQVWEWRTGDELRRLVGNLLADTK